MVFTQDTYYQATFSGLALSSDSIQLKTFEECSFDDCRFVECRFEKCRFIDCQFNRCVLSAIKPTDSRFTRVRFYKCKVIGFDWAKTRQTKELDFAECQLDYSNFRMLIMPKTRMIQCEAKDVDFTETDLSDGDFTKTDFENSRFFKTNLSGADFRGAKNYHIDLASNVINKARFSLPEAMSLLYSLDIIIE